MKISLKTLRTYETILILDMEKKDYKTLGRIYTDNYIVNIILNLSNYTGESIRKKHVIDNSCGNGAFLTEIVNRYCNQCLCENLSAKEIKSEIETYIHGIDIDKNECEKCKNNILNTLKSHGIESANLDIRCADALIIHDYDGKMDYVFGNPPYVRVHNLGFSYENVKKLSATKLGMTDLYIAFFEVGLQMLNKSGKLAYITPNSYFNSLAGSEIRKYFSEAQYIKKILDFKHYKAFKNVSTYTAITVLDKSNSQNEVEYYEFDAKKQSVKFVDKLAKCDFCIGGNFYFSAKSNLKLLKHILSTRDNCDISIKNGYATLSDTVFINDFDFDSPFIKNVVKASRGITKKILYPYDENANLIPENDIKQDKKVYQYLLKNKSRLLNRSITDKDKNWYAFGRTQGLTDTYKSKCAISTLIRDKKDLKITEAPRGVGVYGGQYIVSNTISINDICGALISDEFTTYIALLGKYKNGGYYSFSTKDIKKFLDYKFAHKEKANR